jgi:hypothetical protein
MLLFFVSGGDRSSSGDMFGFPDQAGFPGIRCVAPDVDNMLPLVYIKPTFHGNSVSFHRYPDSGAGSK